MQALVQGKREWGERGQQRVGNRYGNNGEESRKGMDLQMEEIQEESMKRSMIGVVKDVTNMHRLHSNFIVEGFRTVRTSYKVFQPTKTLIDFKN